MRVFNTIHGHELFHCPHNLEYVGPQDGSEERLERNGTFHTLLEAPLRDLKANSVPIFLLLYIINSSLAQLTLFFWTPL